MAFQEEGVKGGNGNWMLPKSVKHYKHFDKK